MKRPTRQLHPRVNAAGLVVLGIVVALAKAAHLLLPVVPAVVWALLFGVLAGLGTEDSRKQAPVLPYELPLLAGFVMMGAQVQPEVFSEVGWRGLVYLLGLWALVVGAFLLAARLKLLPSRLAGLFALGLAGFGVSAVAAVAKHDRTAAGTPQTVATLLILLSGAVALVAYPFIGPVLGLDASTFGAWTGLTVANNAEAIATASTAEHPALLVAAAYKVLVNSFEGVAIVAYLWLFVPREARERGGFKLAIPRIPGFVIGFAAVGAAALLGAFSEAERETLGNLTHWAFFVALVGIGYRTRVRDIFKSARPTLTGLALWALTAALVLFWLTR